jgi:hypothetical protein
MYVSMYFCIHVFIDICVCTCMYIYIYTYTYMCIHINTYIFIYIYIYIYIHTLHPIHVCTYRLSVRDALMRVAMESKDNTGSGLPTPIVVVCGTAFIMAEARAELGELCIYVYVCVYVCMYTCTVHKYVYINV